MSRPASPPAPSRAEQWRTPAAARPRTASGGPRARIASRPRPCPPAHQGLLARRPAHPRPRHRRPGAAGRGTGGGPAALAGRPGGRASPRPGVGRPGRHRPGRPARRPRRGGVRADGRPAGPPTACRAPHRAAPGRPDDPPTPARRGPVGELLGHGHLGAALRRDHRRAGPAVARGDAGRGAALPAGRLSAPVRGPAGAAQAERPASPPHRRPGLADAGRRLPPADLGRLPAGPVAEGPDRPGRGPLRRGAARRGVHQGGVAGPGAVRGGARGRRRTGDRDARPCAGGARRLPGVGQPPRPGAGRVDPLGGVRHDPRRARGGLRLLPGRAGGGDGRLPVAVHPHRGRGVPDHRVGGESGREGARCGAGARGPGGAARLVHGPGRGVPGGARADSARLGRERRRTPRSSR